VCLSAEKEKKSFSSKKKNMPNEIMEQKKVKIE
jgi:hypothetical protein